jgi:hypothetical protein
MFGMICFGVDSQTHTLCAVQLLIVPAAENNGPITIELKGHKSQINGLYALN